MKKTLVLLIAGMALFTACISKNLIQDASMEGYTEEFPVEDARSELCLLYYPTDFKLVLKDSLAKELNSLGYSVTADIMSNGSVYSPADYGAVLLLSQVQAFKPMPYAASFIKYHDYAENIVYFTTYQIFNLPYTSLNKKKIDAITSASIAGNPEKFDDVQDTIIEAVLARLE